jgi:2-polyprenyl-6-methoxyphenol hydroxylase-like FAD-dependent oxidoreductase
LGRERVRGYFITGRRDQHKRLGGAADLPGFVEYCIESGTPDRWFSGIELAGPLATFEGADTWVDHPYRDGVALAGDAAASSDASFGCGLSLTLGTCGR